MLVFTPVTKTPAYSYSLVMHTVIIYESQTYVNVTMWRISICFFSRFFGNLIKYVINHLDILHSTGSLVHQPYKLVGMIVLYTWLHQTSLLQSQMQPVYMKNQSNFDLPINQEHTLLEKASFSTGRKVGLVPVSVTNRQPISTASIGTLATWRRRPRRRGLCPSRRIVWRCPST